MADGEWEDQTESWVRWARTPGFDAYWYYRDAFFDTIVPSPGRRTLEIGCGEGRVARDLAARGHHVTGLDTARGLIRHARQTDDAGPYLVAGAADLPFPDGGFDVVVAYNVLQGVADMPGTVAEAARVLVPGGHLCVCVSHPVVDKGRFLGDEPDAPYALRSRYFESKRVEDTVEQDGMTMTFRGWTYPLEDYASALERAGLAVESIREPRPRPTGSRYSRGERVPLFLNLRAAKR